VNFDASRLRRGELIAGTGALLLFVSMFLGWYGLTVSIVSTRTIPLLSASYDAWRAFSVIDLYLLLTILVALGLVVMQATQRSPALPVALSVITTVLGGIAVLLILFRIIDRPGIVNVPAFVDTHLHRTLKIGIFLGLAGAIGVAYGGFRSTRTEGLAARDARTQVETVVVGRGGVGEG
jgi:hypothetical protein